jgi:phytoene desaturase
MDVWHHGGYRFDTGPSLLTMPFVLRDLFDTVEKRLEDFVDLLPVEPICRYFWSDGSHFDASSDMDRNEGEIRRISQNDAGSLRRFLRHGNRIYDAAFEPFMISEFGSLNIWGLLRNLRRVSALAKIDAMRSLNDAVEEYFVDGRLRQLFNRFATYNGSSPYRAPATLCIIPYIEFTMGGWYIRGGMYALALALERLAHDSEVTIQYTMDVETIERNGTSVTGVRTRCGRFIDADIVVSNADALYAEKELLGGSRTTRAPEPSLAGFVLLLGAKRTWSRLAHHNVFFSDNYQAEFDTMLVQGTPSDLPTIYVCNTSVTDSDHAPTGGSNLFVLVNAPPLSVPNNGNRQFDWEREKERYRDLVIDDLENRGLDGLGASIEVEKIITPSDFEQRYNAFRGSIYGTSSNSRMAAFLRPPNRSRRYDNLYFVGGSSHPGGGIPLVLLSGMIVSNMIQREYASV